MVEILVVPDLCVFGHVQKLHRFLANNTPPARLNCGNRLSQSFDKREKTINIR